MNNFACHATIVIGARQAGKTTFILELQEKFCRRRRDSCFVNFDLSKNEDNADINIGKESSLNKYIFSRKFGPKKALSAYMMKIFKNKKWLKKKISSKNIKYLFIEMPGEMEILHGVGALPQLIQILDSLRCSVCIVFLLDAQFVCDPFSFVGGYLYSMSTILLLNIPHINIITKCDLLDEEQIKIVDHLCSNDDDEIIDSLSSETPESNQLNIEIINVIHNFNIGRFVQFDISNKTTISQIRKIIDDLENIVDESDESDEEDNYHKEFHEEEEKYIDDGEEEEEFYEEDFGEEVEEEENENHVYFDQQENGNYVSNHLENGNHYSDSDQQENVM